MSNVPRRQALPNLGKLDIRHERRVRGSEVVLAREAALAHFTVAIVVDGVAELRSTRVHRRIASAATPVPVVHASTVFAPP
jgi:hypothetical protein